MFSSNTSQQSEGYQIQRSLRFNSADSAYLNRTPASAGNRRIWTWSAWVKRSALGSFSYFFGASPDSFNNTYLLVSFGASDNLRVHDYQGGGFTCRVETTAVYRDVSAWYHIVVAVDTTQATAANRVRLYVNGVEITAFSTATYPTQNADLTVDNNVSHVVGYISSTNNFNGYMTEVNFIDGQALTPSSFGQTNANTGVWEPKPYAGTYGTNGFYLNFSDNSNTTATTLGKDYSGNGNNWTPNNFSVSAGAGNDSLVDVPTPWGTDTGVGGTVRGNYATLNPLNSASGITNGNLDFLISNNTAYGSVGFASSKWYWETTVNNKGDNVGCGISPDSLTITDRAYLGTAGSVYCYFADGTKYNGSSATAYGATFTTGDIIGTAVDLDAGTITFYKNGVSQGTAFTGLTGGFKPQVNGYLSNPSVSLNFGQRPFAYTAPSGFKALCTQNLPTPTIGATAATQADDYFNAVLYTGDRTDRTITVGFQPDFVWVKPRNNADSNYLMNSLSGTGKYLLSNSTASEVTNANSLTAYTSTGFSVGNTGTTNETGRTYVAWNWKANGAGVTNTAGSITSTVSANTTSGFSVVTFTAQSSGTSTVGHGLGAAPKMLIFKSRTSGTDNWATYHASLGSGQIIYLNLTNSAAGSVVPWNSTSPTSSVFTLGTGFAGLGNMVAYCFAEVQGFSKFGSYTGNGSTDGPFVYCGFRPAYVMMRASNHPNAINWFVYDSVRGTYNLDQKILIPNSSGAEIDDAQYGIDLLSNGFKVRNINPNCNSNAINYIFAAFAEFPQKFSLAR